MMQVPDSAYGIFKNVKKAVMQVALNLTELELKVEEATNNEPWGPHGTTMSEIAEAAYDSDKYKEIMGVLARRLQDKDDKWRHVYKALLLLDFMLKHGPQKVVVELRSNVSVIQALERFQYKTPKGKDEGINVRNRAKLLVELISDTERVKEEREKARQNRNKYGGVSAQDARMGGGFSSGGGFRSGGGGSFGSSSPRYDDFDNPSPFSPKPKSSSATGGLEPSARMSSRLGGAGNSSDSVRTSSGPSEYKPPQVEETPAELQKKKLSQTKVNPNIASTFAKISLGPPSQSAAPVSAPAKPQPMPEADNSGWNAFSEPAPPSYEQATSGGGDWDAFSSAPAAVGGQADDWDAFATAPANPTTAPAVEDPFAALAAPSPAPPASADPFATAPAPSQPSVAADPFGADAASSAKAASSAALPEDLFGPPVVSHMGGMHAQQGGGPAAAPPQRGGMMGGMGGMHQQQQQFGMGGIMGGMSPQQQNPGMGGMMGGMPPQMQQQQQQHPGTGYMMGSMLPQQQHPGMGHMMGGMPPQMQQQQYSGMSYMPPQQHPGGMMGGMQPHHAPPSSGYGTNMPTGMAPKSMPAMPAANKAKDPFAGLSGL